MAPVDQAPAAQMQLQGARGRWLAAVPVWIGILLALVCVLLPACYASTPAVRAPAAVPLSRVADEPLIPPKQLYTGAVGSVGSWLDQNPPLIAHAGGAVARRDGAPILESNARETLEGSYALGFRVYEYDLVLTADGRLAVLHDWIQVGGIKTAQGWLESSYKGLTTMLLEDVLDFMATHRDVYLVTDTKSFEYGADEIRAQFKLIYELALARDATLPRRIIPQIYNQPMYDLVKEVYDFPSIIYTLYASTDTEAQVVEFVTARDDIETVVMPEETARLAFLAQLNAAGKCVYVHTINDLDTMSRLREAGVRGFYTDLVTAEQFSARFGGDASLPGAA